ncbi:MAG: methyltransferase domain-containing protein [Gammaproteobacteria bacterium]
MVSALGYVDPSYLRSAAQLLCALKEDSYDWMQAERGHRVLDLGCGPGTDTLALAERVGSTGMVVGIDRDPAMLKEAERRAGEAHLGTRIVHHLADATRLPLRSGSFDASRSERLLQHLSDPAAALGELLRVTRRGGWVVVLDTDWGTLSLHSPEIEIERRLARVHADHLLHNGYAGRQIYHLFKRQGTADVRVAVYPVFAVDLAQVRVLTVLDEVERKAIDLGVLTPVELSRWHASLRALEDEDGVFCSATLVMVAGRKP